MNEHRRIVITAAGGRECLALQDFTPRPPGSGEVSIAVRAIGLNFADVFCRLGLYAAAPPFPFCPGFEVSGTIEELGEGVTDFRPGDSVFAVTRFGGYTTQLVIAAGRVRLLPAGWSLAEGAAFPVAALTAWYGLHHVGRMQPGETIVVTSAAGGVGTHACRLARSAGARVLGAVGSEEKKTVALEAGAHEVVVSKEYEIWDEVHRLTASEGVDLIFDAVGGRQLRRAYDELRRDGRLVCYGFAEMTPPGGRRRWTRLAWRYLRTPRFSPFGLVQENRTVTGFNLVHLWDREALLEEATNQLLALAARENLRPLIGATFPFERVADAHDHLQSRRSVGKVVLEVS